MISLLPALLAGLGGAEAQPLPATVELAFRPYQQWDILLPEERFAKVGEGIVCPHAGGERFKVELEGTVLRVDRDGDGECDAKVEPLEKGQTGLVVFRGKDAAGAEIGYAVRLSSEGTWSYATSGAMVGELAGERLQLIDQNNNGRYDDYGADAMIVGRGKAASFLSRVVSVDGKLYSIDVSADGKRVDAVPYDGAVGTLDLASQLATKARMRSVVLRSADGQLSFEVSRADGALALPAGDYTVHSGKVALGNNKADLHTGRMQPLHVEAGATVTCAWGGPVKAEFEYARSGDKVQIGPRDIRYYGRAGELYTDFMPLGSSPNFVVKDKRTGEVLVNAKFPGNC
ncbi:MAG: hypothetical protein H6828_02370 [Planctomycetes bacterium]|nr:hypothetical protein [Planctomycetota bacterium]